MAQDEENEELTIHEEAEAAEETDPLQVIAVRVLGIEGEDDKTTYPFEEWLRGFRDKRIRVRILTRLNRVRRGNFGDARGLGTIMELRLDFGSGYRIYLARVGEVLVILLGGGDKSTQPRDIERAREYWEKYRDAPERYNRDLPE